MSADTFLARARSLARLPVAHQPGDWAALATAFNALDDRLSMGGDLPQAWLPAAWKPYTPKEPAVVPAGAPTLFDQEAI